MSWLKALKVILALCVLVASSTVLFAAYWVNLAFKGTLFFAGAHYTTGNFIRIGMAAMMAVLSILYIAIFIREQKPR